MNRPKRHAQKQKDPDFDYGDSVIVLGPSNHIESHTPKRQALASRKRQRSGKSTPKSRARSTCKTPVSKPRTKKTRVQDLSASPELYDADFGGDNLDDSDLVLGSVDIEEAVSESQSAVKSVLSTLDHSSDQPKLVIDVDPCSRLEHTDHGLSGIRRLPNGTIGRQSHPSDSSATTVASTTSPVNEMKINVAGNMGNIKLTYISPSGVVINNGTASVPHSVSGETFPQSNTLKVLHPSKTVAQPMYHNANTNGWLSASNCSFQTTNTTRLPAVNTESVAHTVSKPNVGSVAVATESVISSRASLSPVPQPPPACDITVMVPPGGSHLNTPTHSAVTPITFYPNSTRQPAVTPTTGGSIKDKIKKQLAQNAKVSTTPGSLDQKQVVSREIAVKEAEDLRALQSTQDVGPFYGLPTRVKELLEKHRGISSLYDWQDECLSLPAVRQGRNLIYSLPTSGGKTLVAEILILRALLCQKKDVIFSLPFVAIVQEKVKTLSPFALDLEFLVEEYAASRGQIPPRKRRNRNSIYVCTIEKANALINSLINEDRLSDVGLMVVDELHMLGEGGSRGACLEQSIVKMMHTCPEIQIIGMSATLSNIEDLSKFMNAEIYSNNFRPVKLDEYVKLEDTLYKIEGKALGPDDRLKHHRTITFSYDGPMKQNDPDHLVGLVNEVVPKHSCLVFCSTKKNCENVAELLCKLSPGNLLEVKHEEKKALMTALWHDGNGQVCPVLQKTVPYGVAYHHSGLTMDERKLIEEAYSDGTLCLLTCTSTLAAGVNLPAKRVILRSPNVGMSFMSRSQYKQMVGRAGRAGLDDSGESILIINRKDKLKLLDLVSGPYDMCKSSLLYEASKGMRALLLTTIGLQVTETWESVCEFMRRTLCHIQNVGPDISEGAGEALSRLIELDLVRQVLPNGHVGAESVTDPSALLQVTRVGRAVFKGPIDVDRGTQLYADLSQAQQSLVVANHLHLLYLVTPYDLASEVRLEWMVFLQEINCLSDQEMKVATLVGISPSYIAKKATSQRTKSGVDEFPMKRFYLTLILYRLWKHQSIWDVAEHFRQGRGFIQGLLNSAAAFASCISHFCRELEEFWAYQDLFTTFVRKLTHCHIAELLPLLEIPGVKIGRARQLNKAGYRNLQQVAHADPNDLVTAIEHMPRKVAKQIVAAAKMMVKDKIDTLREEVEELTSTPAKPEVSVRP